MSQAATATFVLTRHVGYPGLNLGPHNAPETIGSLSHASDTRHTLGFG
jgi:hypothetical protein